MHGAVDASPTNAHRDETCGHEVMHMEVSRSDAIICPPSASAVPTHFQR